jgi:hypothetical protein
MIIGGCAIKPVCGAGHPPGKDRECPVIFFSYFLNTIANAEIDDPASSRPIPGSYWPLYWRRLLSPPI